jgi:hypothetical protein
VVGIDKITVKENCAPPKEPPECKRTVENTIDELKRLLRKHWTCFQGFSISGVQ